MRYSAEGSAVWRHAAQDCDAAGWNRRSCAAQQSFADEIGVGNRTENGRKSGLANSQPVTAVAACTSAPSSSARRWDPAADIHAVVFDFLVKQTGRQRFYRYPEASLHEKGGVRPMNKSDGTQRQDRQGVVVDFLMKQSGRRRF